MNWADWLCGAIGGAGLTLAAQWLRTRLSRPAAAPPHEASPDAFLVRELPIGVLFFGTSGQIQFANVPARDLLFSGQDPKGKNFLHLLGNASAPVCHALTGSRDSLFTLEADGEQQTYQVLRREVEFEQAPHIVLLINPLTREVARREVDLLKKVIQVINHELNNSLASMSSLISSGRFIVDHPEKLNRLTQVLDGIEGRTAHLQKFLNEYARLSRLPTARANSVPWAPLLARLTQLYPGIEIGQPPDPSGWFDEVQLEQALINLIKNACEAEGPAEQVRVAMRNVDNALEIGVLDRGRGFSKEALQHGLLPFYSTKEGGSGVGLALCREVAEGHGGRLRIKSREGGGSAVYLVLPFREVARAPSKSIALTLTHT